MELEETLFRERIMSFSTLNNLDAKLVAGTLAMGSTGETVKESSNAVGYTFGVYAAAVIAIGLGIKLYRHFRRKE